MNPSLCLSFFFLNSSICLITTSSKAATSRDWLLFFLDLAVVYRLVHYVTVRVKRLLLLKEFLSVGSGGEKKERRGRKPVATQTDDVLDVAGTRALMASYTQTHTLLEEYYTSLD
jgi:hypothetical protein